MKKTFNFILAFCMIIQLLIPAYAFAADNYVLGFNSETEFEGITVTPQAFTDIDYDEVCGAMVVRPNFSKNVVVKIPVDSASINGRGYAKIRYFFKGTFCNEAKFLIAAGDNTYEADTLNGKNYGKWYESVFPVQNIGGADSISFMPVLADENDWSTTQSIYVDYIGFFNSESDAQSFSEPDDVDYMPGYNPVDEKSKLSVTQEVKFAKGYANARSFRPESLISRAEAAAMISRIINNGAKGGSELPFTDVAQDSWYYADVDKLYSNGIIMGAELYRPDDAITRGEFTTMIYRLDLFDIMKVSEFADVNDGEYFYKPIITAAGNGIVNGYNDGLFRPYNSITRAETVVMLNRITGNDKIESEPQGILYDDVPETYWAYRDIMLASNGAAMSEGEGGSGEVQLLNGIFDQYNSKGDVWEPVPFVTQEMLDNGNMGGEGGQIQVALKIDSTGDFLLTHADVGNMQRSIDGGKTWQDCGRGLGGEGVNNSAIDPNNSARVISVTRNGASDALVRRFKNTNFGLYLSEDYAESFTQVMTYSDPGMHRFRECLKFDPTSFDEKINGSAVVYFSTETDPMPDNFVALSQYEQEQGYHQGPGLYRSDDGGHTWKFINKDMAQASITVSYDDGTVFAVKNQVLYRSTDKGETFEQVLSDIFYADNIVTEPKNVYALGSGGVYTSKDNGATFEKTGSAPPPMGTAGVTDFKVSPADTSRMALGRRSTDTTDCYDIAYTHDGGTSWQLSKYDESSNIFEQEPRCKMIAWHPTNPDQLWTNADWVESSQDGGKNIHWDFNGGVGTCINSWWRPNIYNSDIWLVPIQDFTGVITFDGGKTFKKVRDYAQSQSLSHLYGGYCVDENTMFVGSTKNWESPTLDLKGTHDGGATWESYGTITSGFTNSRFFQSPSDPNVIFAGNLRSTDGGYNWETMADVKCVSAYSKKSPDMYGFGADGYSVKKSSDNGATWTDVVNVTPIEGREWSTMQYGLDYDYDNNILYYSQYGEIWKVQNGKTTSLKQATIDGGGEGWCNGFAVDPIHPEVLYATLMGSQASYFSDCQDVYTIIRSCDSGETWQTISSVDNDKTIVKDGPAVGRGTKRYIFVHPETGYAYFSAANNGLWRLPPPYELN